MDSSTWMACLWMVRTLIAYFSSSVVHIHIIHPPSFPSSTYFNMPHHSDPSSHPISIQFLCSSLGAEHSLVPTLFVFSYSPLSLECSWLGMALIKVPVTMLCTEHQSLCSVPLTWEQLCRHKLHSKTTCRWPWRPPEGTVRTHKWDSVLGECLRKE